MSEYRLKFVGVLIQQGQFGPTFQAGLQGVVPHQPFIVSEN